MQYNFQQIENIWIQAGGNPAMAPVMAAIAMAESSGDASNTTGDNGTSYGLWQIHWTVHPQFNPQDLLNPLYNAEAAIQLSGNGVNLTPWTTFKNGSYLQYLPAGLQHAISSMGTSGSSGTWSPHGVTVSDWSSASKWIVISIAVLVLGIFGWSSIKQAL